MNAKQTLITAISVATLALAGCNSSDSGGATGKHNMDMLVQNTGTVSGKLTPASAVFAAPVVGEPIVFNDGTTSFSITNARLHVGELILNSDDSTTHTVTGPFLMDLVNGGATPADLTFDAPTGNYTSIEVSIDEAGSDVVTAEDPMLGNVLYIEGTHNYSGSLTDPATFTDTFTLAISVSERFTLQPSNGIVIDENTATQLDLNFRVTDWLVDANGGTIDLSGCVAANGLADGSNHITMTEDTQCEAIGENIGTLIKNNLQNKYDFSQD